MANKPNNILVIGAGATGSVLINTLAKSKKIAHVFCLAKDKNSARELIKPHPKVKIFSGDINHSREVERLAHKANLIVNAASPWLNIKILKLAIKTNTHYQDLAAYLGFDDGRSKNPYKIEHLAFDKAFKKKKLLALFDAGVAPGLTNLLVAQAADRFKTLNNVKIRLVENLKASTIISTWSPQAMVDEIYSRPLIYKSGKFVILPRFYHPEEFAFPKPFGKMITYPIMNNESFTIPHYIKLNNMEVRSAGNDDEIARLMVSLGLLEKKKINIHGESISPLEFMMKIMPAPPTPKELKKLMKLKLVKDGFFALSIEIVGSMGRMDKKINYWVNFASQKELFKRGIYSTYIAYPAGLCAAAFTLEIPNVKVYGTMPPEALPKENRVNILNNIKKLGININN